MVSDVLLGLSLELLPAAASTEVIRFTLIYTFIDGSQATDLHSADRVFEAVFIVLVFHC